MEAGRLEAGAKMLATELRSYVPLIWNEIEDLGESFGLSPEQPDGIVIPLVDAILGLNDTSLKDIRNKVAEKFGLGGEDARKAGEEIIKTGAELTDMTDDEEYNPKTDAGGVYN
jgi:hypothetical protein